MPTKYCHIYKNYYITIDRNQYGLYKLTNQLDAKGKVIYQNLNCFTNKLTSIVNAIIRQEQMDMFPKNLYDLIELNQELYSELMSTIKKAMKEGN